MLKFTLSLAIIFLLGSITISQASELTEISVSITGDSIISLDSTNRLIRANVEIENFDPAGDGYYFMKVIQLSTGKVLTESEIQPKDRGNQIWGVHIAYLFDEDKVGTSIDDVIGDYEIQIITEYGTSTATTSFSIVESSQSESEDSSSDTTAEQVSTEKPEIVVSTGFSVPPWVKNNAGWWANGQVEDSEFVSSIGYLINQKIIKLDMPEPSEEETKYKSSLEKPSSEIPEWIKNNAKWWSENQISTKDFVNGIKYLVEHGIIRV